jgi:hypothetical protein
MTTKNIFITAALGASFFIQAQTTQKRDITAFTKIDASGAVPVVFENSASPSLIIEGDAEEIKQIETSVKNNVLYIKTKGNFHHEFKVKVSGSNLNAVSVSGASSFKSASPIKADVFTIRASGASSIKMPLTAKSVHTDIDGASSIHLSGSTQELFADISGASDLKAGDLKSAIASVTASGASSAKVYASEKISTNTSGASSVKYDGNPKDITKKNTSINESDN